MFLARLNYDDPRLFQVLGGNKPMIESPLLKELMAENTLANILKFLVARFGPDARKLRTAIGAIDSDKRLASLIDQSARCPDLESFKKLLEP
jgi:hypothetical protein